MKKIGFSKASFIPVKLMRVLGIIPARGGSKRLPRKNLRLLAGKPLLAWIIEAASHASKLSKLVVSSDDEEILKLVSSYNPLLALERPSELATDTSLAIEYVRHALTTLESDGKTSFDAVTILQPSSPLTTSDDIDACIKMLEETGADTVVSVVQLDHMIHPLKHKVMVGNRLLPFIEAERGRMAAHELPQVFVRNCAVYVTKREVVAQGSVVGEDCRGYIMPRDRSLDINEEIDLLFAEFLVARKHQA